MYLDVCGGALCSSSSSGSGSGMIADQYEAQEDTVWAPVMGEARAVKQSYPWRLRLPVCIVLGMAAAVFLVVGCGNMVGNGSWSCNKLGLERRCAKAPTMVVARMLGINATPRTSIGPSVCTHATQRPCRNTTSKEAIGAAIQLELVILPITVWITITVRCFP